MWDATTNSDADRGCSKPLPPKPAVEVLRGGSVTSGPAAGGPRLRRGYRDLTVTTEDDTLPAPSVASALRVWVPVVFGTVQAQA